MDGDITGEMAIAPNDLGESSDAAAAGRPGGERAGLYLAALVALAVPSLIVLAFFLPTSSASTSVEVDDTVNDVPAGLDAREVPAPVDGEDREALSGDSIPVIVAGAGDARFEGAERFEDGDEAVAEIDAPPDADTTPAPSASPRSTTAPIDGTNPTPTTATTSPSAPTTSTPTTTATPTTTTAPTTSTPTTTATPTTTTTPATTTAPPELEAVPDVEPPAFAQRIDIGRIGETTLQIRFMSAENATYTATVRDGAQVVARETGAARANVLVNETVQGLEPGTPYSVDVELAGRETARSPRLSFQTSGGGAIEPDDEPVAVAVENLRVAQVERTRFEVRYDSNICANGSFVIRKVGGAQVGANNGQPSGCTTRHLSIPGFWTPQLEPATTYVITVQVEAAGAGRGNGNTATRSLTVTTSG